jgi:hypothetical protein
VITCNGAYRLCGGACTTTVPRQVLANPGFDSGRAPWVEVSPSPPIISIDTSLTFKAQTPSYFAWLALYDNAQEEIYQDVTLPLEATSITLSFYYAIFTDESTAAANDFMYVAYQPMGGPTPITLATFNDNMATSTWTRFTVSLPASLAGQTFRVSFRATTNASDYTGFMVDSVSLDVNACPL